jgi:hypothetical protein
MDTPLFSGHLGTFDTLSHLMLSLQELMLYLKAYLQVAQKWLPIMTYIHPPIIVPSLGLHNAHLLLALKISRKKLIRVYNAHELSKKIAVGNVRIKYQLYIFFSPLSMFHLLGEFKNHLSLFIFNKVAKY